MSNPRRNPLRNPWQRKWLDLDVTCPQIQTLADVAEKFCGRWFRNDADKSLIVLVGDVRSGKTHTAKKIYRFAHTLAFKALESGKWGLNVPSVLYVSWPEAATSLAEKNFRFVEDSKDASLLIGDDVGAENDPWKVCADALCQILSRRERMFTVATTNVASGEWATRFDARIADRLFRNSNIVDLSNIEPFKS